MDIKFTFECTFIFPSISTKSDEEKKFLIYLTIIIIYSIFTQFILAIQQRYKLQNSKKLLECFCFLINLINWVFIMFLLMTCNAWVIIATVLSQIFGFLIFIPVSYKKKNNNTYLTISHNNSSSLSMKSLDKI